MIKKIIGTLFIIIGIAALSNKDILTATVCIVLGAALIWYKREKEVIKGAIASELIEADNVFTFTPVGSRFECRIDGRWHSRQEVLAVVKVGDTCRLSGYEWAGAQSIMVVPDRIEQDLGVVPEHLVDTVMNLMIQYNITVKITAKNEFVKEGETYDGCEATIYCKKK